MFLQLSKRLMRKPVGKRSFKRLRIRKTKNGLTRSLPSKRKARHIKQLKPPRKKPLSMIRNQNSQIQRRK
jgi:hypothetical protein